MAMIALAAWTLLAAFALLLVWVLVPWAVALWQWRHVPGPFPLPVLGSVPWLVQLGLHRFLQQQRAKYKARGVFKVFLGPRMVIVTADPEDARLVMLKSNTRFLQRTLDVGRTPGDITVLDGLVGVNGPLWRTLRLAWQPTFSSGNLQGYAPLMDRAALRLTALLERVADEGRVVDIHRELGNMTLDVVGTTALGVDFQALPDPKGGAPDPHGRALVEAAAHIFAASSASNASVWQRLVAFAPWAAPLWRRLALRFPDGRLVKLNAARALLRESSYGVIDAWRAAHAAPPDANGASDGKAPASSPHSNGNATAGSGRKRMAAAPGSFMGLLLESRDQETGEKLTDRQLAAQANTFILAGYETTANALAFTIYCLAAHPKAQAALLQELDAWQEAHPGQDPAHAELPYTMGAINEALRLYPPATATSRLVGPKGITLPSCGIHLPEDTIVVCPSYAFHNDPDYWPHVEEFLPERWTEAGAAALGPSLPESLVFLPFGSGARACVGLRFALQEAKVALVRLYQRLKFVLEPGQTPLAVRQGITMGPKNGVLVRVQRRMPQ